MDRHALGEAVEAQQAALVTVRTIFQPRLRLDVIVWSRPVRRGAIVTGRHPLVLAQNLCYAKGLVARLKMQFEMMDRIVEAIQRGIDKDHAAATIAAAVLEVLREPDEAMVSEGYKANTRTPVGCGLAHSFAPTPAWQAMIKAIAQPTAAAPLTPTA